MAAGVGAVSDADQLRKSHGGAEIRSVSCLV